MKITVIVASQGKNMEVAHRVNNFLISKNVESEIIDVVALDLPLYSTKAEGSYDPAQLISPIMQKLTADAFVFIAPEYNGSVPPTFANFLAWVSRSTKEWRDAFNGKPCLIGTHSAGGGLSVLTVMRLQLAFLGMNVLGRQLHSTLAKGIEDPSLTLCCEQLINLAQKISGK
jgi:chromate reductase, NAD(P)H dehydrogenase (quinone)